MPLHPNLYRRANGVLYLRIFIPTSLIARFECREFTRSSGTRSHKGAKRLARAVGAGFDEIFTMARLNPSLSSAELRELAKQFFERTLSEAKANYLSTRLRPGELEHQLSEVDDSIERIEDWISRNQLSQADEAVAEISEHDGISLDPESGEAKQLAHLALRALLDVQKIMRAHMAGRYDLPASDVLFAGSNRQTIMPNGHANDATGSIPFSELVERFLAEYKSVWQPKTYAKYSANLAVCLTFSGPTLPSKQIDKAVVRSIKQALQELPARVSQLHKGEKIEVLRDQVRRGSLAPMETGSLNAYLASLSSLMSWAVKQGYSDSNPVQGMRVADSVREQDKRLPFSTNQLNSIFSAPIDCGMRSNHRWAEKGNEIIRDSRYWIPVVGLFTGMRLGEILTLRKEHIENHDGKFFFRIVKAKTKSGIRIVPLHAFLVEFGLLEFLESKKVGELLFAPYAQNAFSKFFRRFLDSQTLTDERLVFHSFRHTFADALRRARVDEPVMKALLGHSDGTVTGIYGNGYEPALLFEEINKIEYPSLVLLEAKPRSTPTFEGALSA